MKRLIATEKPSPIPCAGTRDYWGEFDCNYPHAGKIECDKCIVNGGVMDPRTGKRVKKEK